MPVTFDFTAELWEWEGKAAWHFITVPVGISDEIAARLDGFTSGFGSVRVRVRIGTSEWDTSVFPDSKRGSYLLPVKKSVRAAQNLSVGTVASVRLEVEHPRP